MFASRLRIPCKAVFALPACGESARSGEVIQVACDFFGGTALGLAPGFRLQKSVGECARKSLSIRSSASWTFPCHSKCFTLSSRFDISDRDRRAAAEDIPEPVPQSRCLARPTASLSPHPSSCPKFPLPARPARSSGPYDLVLDWYRPGTSLLPGTSSLKPAVLLQCGQHSLVSNSSNRSGRIGPDSLSLRSILPTLPSTPFARGPQCPPAHPDTTMPAYPTATGAACSQMYRNFSWRWSWNSCTAFDRVFRPKLLNSCPWITDDVSQIAIYVSSTRRYCADYMSRAAVVPSRGTES
jgi:hypothetical protein